MRTDSAGSLPVAIPMPDDAEHVVFELSEANQTRASAHLYVVLLHQLSCRAQLNDLAMRSSDLLSSLSVSCTRCASELPSL